MILNIYKPKHWTSFDVVAKTRSILKTKKVGHAGTLDPLAEGVLIVLTDKDTKRQSEFMKLSKEYQAEIGFGLKSPTYDLEGPVELKYSNILLTEFE
ncbi:MAG TPA: tRNA pseudouridine(55) synthase, partial [Patescibacteria group bacterium]|nr:tRNA pseudouridine(55) synthase [Patescibacteria group bacterium]